MIERDLDVKDLINSSLFYAPIWTNYSLFSPEQEPVIHPVNCDIEDLEFEDPNIIFNLSENECWADKAFNKLTSIFENKNKPKVEETYEMQYNFIYISKVCGEDKLAISRILKDCNDLALFEQEPI